MNFLKKLADAIDRNQSLLCVGLDPDPAKLPTKFRTSTTPKGMATAGQSAPSFTPVDELLAWNQAIISETWDFTCVYKPNIAFYEALGTDGMWLLRKTLELIPDDIPVLLDAKRGDIGSTAEAYAKACFDDLNVDAVTLSPYLGRDSISPFAQYADKGLFVLCHTSNPSASEFQTMEVADWQLLDREPNWPLYLHVARTATQWSPNVGLVVGATYPDAMEAVRRVAPKAWILAPGIGSQGGDLEATLSAGLRTDGTGMLINVSRSIAQADSPGDAAKTLRDNINAVRLDRSYTVGAQSTSNERKASTADPDIGPHDERLKSLVCQLASLGAVKFGEFTLASGMTSPFYIDLRLLVSAPSLLSYAASLYKPLLNQLNVDRIAGVPYAGLPIATTLSVQANKPMIYTRKEVKEHGLGKNVEGAWQKGDRVVIIEDVATSGGSIIDTAIKLRALGLIIEDAIVLIDREHNAAEKLALAGIKMHSVVGLSDMLHILIESGQLTEDKLQEIIKFVRGG